MPKTAVYYLYIVQCADLTFYTGVTTNLKQRIAQHNGEKPGGAKYTLGRRPVKIVYTEQFQNRSQAQQREYHIKQLSKQNKHLLINSWLQNKDRLP